PFNIDKAKHECSVDLGDQRLVFRWYPEAGSRNIQYRVRDLVRSDKPPLALVGANNSTMTQAMVAELAAHSDSPATPVALRTYGTADYLLGSYPQRSFRFRFNNSYQAQAVVARLMDYYQEKKGKEGPLNVVLVEVLDDPFSVD